MDTQYELGSKMEKILEFLATDFSYEEPTEPLKSILAENKKSFFRFSHSTPFLPSRLVKNFTDSLQYKKAGLNYKL